MKSRVSPSGGAPQRATGLTTPGNWHVFPVQAAGEPACRPGSVHPLARAGGHPSGTAVTGSLVRSTREHRAGRPQALAQETRQQRRASLLTLLRVEFTKPLRSPQALVVSYTTGGSTMTCAFAPRLRCSPPIARGGHDAVTCHRARATWRAGTLGGRWPRGCCLTRDG